MFALRSAAPLARTFARSAPRFVAPSSILSRSIVTKRYSQDHEWLSFDSDTGVGSIGITDYAQRQLGDVVFIELPGQGTEIATGDSIGTIESVKAVSEIYAPVSGRVEEINGELESSPETLNSDPENEGWLAKIKLSNPGEFEQLLSEEAYKAYCAGADQ
ncbi:glycine dehydrogenase [Leucosporidium creatinivorum]|uniref:Glycine cleavage system H protein n=1 Tax=Leucosporidium creatinivorum TaxID=106004 RepID=A0A1Y2F3F8_9BASI|nr:glycine dehydrogenase [Leucosporidium creatinivorum]